MTNIMGKHIFSSVFKIAVFLTSIALHMHFVSWILVDTEMRYLEYCKLL